MPRPLVRDNFLLIFNIRSISWYVYHASSRYIKVSHLFTMVKYFKFFSIIFKACYCIYRKITTNYLSWQTPKAQIPQLSLPKRLGALPNSVRWRWTSSALQPWRASTTSVTMQQTAWSIEGLGGQISKRTRRKTRIRSANH